jgi:pyruvate dehydrogenase E2 component (dihydrolipoamide acetyltransferase)
MRLPELGLDAAAPAAGAWRFACGALVVEGDPLLEVVAGAVTVEVPAPVTGVLVRTLVSPGAQLRTGQPVALIRCDEDA